MIQLTSENIRLQAQAASKEEAIRIAGGVLVEGGYVAKGYVESILGRELQANTYLGNGIAIPHGMAADRELIVTELCMSIPSIAAVKAHLRGVSHAKAKARASQALACATAEEVRALF